MNKIMLTEATVSSPKAWINVISIIIIKINFFSVLKLFWAAFLNNYYCCYYY